MGYQCHCDYDSAPSVYLAERRTARKPHECYECGGPVLAGERYEHVWGVWDGRPDVYRTCNRCLNIRIFTANSLPCLCWYHGDVIESCRDALEEAAYYAPAEMLGVRTRFWRMVIERDRFNKQHKGK